MASEILYMALLVVPAFFADWSLVIAPQAHYIVVECLLCCTVLRMAAIHSDWYVKWRGVLLGCRQMIKLTLFYIVVADSESFKGIHPLEMPTSFFGRLKFFLFIPLSLVQVGIRHLF